MFSSKFSGTASSSPKPLESSSSMLPSLIAASPSRVFSILAPSLIPSRLYPIRTAKPFLNTVRKEL
eukprot:scaffold78230_cov61-Attheya_sp.AAC.10